MYFAYRPYCIRLCHFNKIYLLTYLSYRYARSIIYCISEQQSEGEFTHHQYVWKGLRARESCGGRRRPHRSSRPGARCCDDHRSPLSCPLEAGASNCYVKALICGMETSSLICCGDLRLLKHMMINTLSKAPLLLTTLRSVAPIEFWIASRRRLCKKQDHC